MRRKDEERRTGETENGSTALTVEGPMRHSNPRLEGAKEKCERLSQARKDPEAKVRSAALAAQKATTYNPQSVLPVTTSQPLSRRCFSIVGRA